jgi:hypothetical protein
MSATLTQTPGVSRGPILGGFANIAPVTLAAGAIVPKGLWLATGAGLATTPVFTYTPPPTTAVPSPTAVACQLICSDGETINTTAALTLYRYIFG